MNYSRILFLLILFATSIGNGQKNKPSGLLCELLPHPELSVITNKKPDFGWIVNSDIIGDYQTAYQIQVATSPVLLKDNNVDLWDSGKIFSKKSINISYKGKEIKPSHSYWWRVRNWNKSGIKSAWSETQQFNLLGLNSPDACIVRKGKFENLKFSLKKLSSTKYLVCLHRGSLLPLISTIPVLGQEKVIG